MCLFVLGRCTTTEVAVSYSLVFEQMMRVKLFLTSTRFIDNTYNIYISK